LNGSWNFANARECDFTEIPTQNTLIKWKSAAQMVWWYCTVALYLSIYLFTIWPL